MQQNFRAGAVEQRQSEFVHFKLHHVQRNIRVDISYSATDFSDRAKLGEQGFEELDNPYTLTAIAAVHT